jgi:hypothetical protein
MTKTNKIGEQDDKLTKVWMKVQLGSLKGIDEKFECLNLSVSS